jgi:outer membrane protein assembly factor BamB
MKNRYITLCIFISIFSISGILPAQENWPHWRGPNHNGICDATNLPLNWSSAENIVWKTELLSWSAGTPIIWGDQIFITSPSKVDNETVKERKKSYEQNRRRRSYLDPGGSSLLLLCISKKDGKILWHRELDDKNELHRKSNDSSSSPVTDGINVWVMTGTGVITAFDMAGNQIWQRKLQQEFGKFGLNFGYGSSPLLHDNQLIIQVIHGCKTKDPSYIISLETKTGTTLWRQLRITDAEKESKDSYTTPLLLKNGEENQLIISGGDYVTGHFPDTGKEIWRAGGMNPLKRSNFRVISSPVIADGMIYVPTRKKPLQVFRLGGIGDITESNFLWKWEGRGAPDVPSPLCNGKYFYMVDDKGLITCLDAKTGDVIWGPERTSEGIVSASPILANGKIYILNEKAVTTVIKEGPEFKLLATNELDSTYTLASPAISKNQLFIRTSTHLYCIGVN